MIGNCLAYRNLMRIYSDNQTISDLFSNISHKSSTIKKCQTLTLIALWQNFSKPN